MDGHKHYHRVNEAGEIIFGFSDAFEQPQPGDILVLENGPRHHHLAFPEPYINERGQYRFRRIAGNQVAKSQEELDAEWATRPPAPPTAEQQIATLNQTAQTLDERTMGMQDIDFFTLQQTDNLDQRTQGMQDVDQFTLEQVMEMQAEIEQLKTEISTLMGGA